MIGRGRRRAPGSLLLAASLLVAVLLPAVAVTADPSVGPSGAASPGPTTSSVPTCAQRYPDPGPAGIDLRLGCIVSSLVGTYSDPANSAAAPRISTWLVPLAVGLTAVLVAALGVRIVRRRAGRRLVAASPTAWWSCPACRSLNAAGAEACYRCGRAWEAGAVEMRTDGEPPAPQSFGRHADD